MPSFKVTVSGRITLTVIKEFIVDEAEDEDDAAEFAEEMALSMPAVIDWDILDDEMDVEAECVEPYSDDAGQAEE